MPAANPPVPQMRGAYTDLAPSGQPMRLQRVRPAENRIEPWRQRATLRTGTGSEETYQGKGRDASGDRHGRGQRRTDLLRGCGRRGPAGPRTRGDRGQQDVGRPTHGLRRPLQGHPPRHAGLRDDRDGGGTVLLPRGPARSTRLSERRAGAPRELFDGGGTVLDFALEYPQRVGNLVLVGSAVGGFGPEIDPPRQWDEILAAEEAGDLERVSELEVQVWVDGPGRSPEDVDASVRDLVREMNLIALRNEASGLGDEWAPEPPAAHRLPDVQAPTLLIVGDEDQPSVFAAADLLERELPNVRKVVMHGAAHLPNMEKPEEFNRIVLDFLRDYR